MTGPWTPSRLPEWPVFVADLRADAVEPSIVAEWWGEKGGGLPGLLLAYANPPLRDLCDVRPYVPHTPGNFDCLHCHPRYDDSLRPLLAAYHAANGDPGRAAAVRGLTYYRNNVGTWTVTSRIIPRHYDATGHPTEPAARAALKRAVLGLYDGDRVPCPKCKGTHFVDTGFLGRYCDRCDDGRVPLRVPCPGCARRMGGRFAPRTTCLRCGGAGVVPPSELAAEGAGAPAVDFTNFREQAFREIARGLGVPARLLRDRPGEADA